MMRVVDSNLMPLAATVVVLIYAAGVIIRHGGLWYEWLAVVAGVGFATWFWFTEYKRVQRRKGK
jgi:hypothetical protein